MKNKLQSEYLQEILFELKIKSETLFTELYSKLNFLSKESFNKIEIHIKNQIIEIENIHNITNWGKIKTLSDILYLYFKDTDIDKEYAINKMHFWIQNYEKENKELKNKIEELEKRK
jgi:hypothetical protein